jgi:predicted ribosome quality control (RQC) complex YloA/Tae2 family protein
MMGKHSNLLLLDEEGRILDAVKHVSRKVNRHREILPNRPYTPPPSPDRPDPLAVSSEELGQTLTQLGDGLTPQTLVKNLANIGPLLAKETLARAEAATPSSVTTALADLLSRVREGRYTPTLLMDESDRPADAWAFDLRSFPADRQDRAPSMSLALEIARQFHERQTDLDALRSEARERLTSLVQRGQRHLTELMEAREQAERAEEFRRMGEILQSSIPQLERGQTEALLTDYYDPEMKPLRIPLDPQLSPQENAEAYFRRHRKARSGLPHLLAQTEGTERNLREWRRSLEELPEADADYLKAILTETAPSAGPEAAGGDGKKDEARRPAPGVRRIRSSDGYEIFYGEHKEGNATLTTKIAAPTDIWLHVRAGASSHVVIRTGKRPEAVPQRTLMEAAQIAASHSESKHSTVVPVDYTLKKYVRKPRGSGTGQALYTHEKTLHVEQKP